MTMRVSHAAYVWDLFTQEIFQAKDPRDPPRISIQAPCGGFQVGISRQVTTLRQQERVRITDMPKGRWPTAAPVPATRARKPTL